MQNIEVEIRMGKVKELNMGEGMMLHLVGGKIWD